MSGIGARLGPGMMLAAVAVGVSHLVHATRAGADYGLSFTWLVVLIVVLKYPAFRFAVDYAGATGRSLVSGFSNHSRLATGWLALAFFVDMFISSGAVALVTAGLLISVFDLPFTGPQVAVALMVFTAIVLLNGHYAKAERIVKWLVVVFSVLSVTTLVFALPLLGSDGRELFAEVTPDRSVAIFVIAVAGWMPMPMTGAIFQSVWLSEKRRSGSAGFDHLRALQDLRFGYSLTLILAICFLVMGTAVLFQAGRELPDNAGAFAADLLRIFTVVIGDWSYPVVAAAALAVMWSTLIALMDALPRASDRVLGIVTGRAPDAPGRYTRFLLLQVAGVSFILLFMMRGFGAFVDFAASTAFIAAPALAWYAYRSVTAAEIGPEFRPGRLLTAWSWLSVIMLSVFALSYLLLRLFGD